jgi:hypothetical protein
MIDRFRAADCHHEQTSSTEHGRRIRWNEELIVKFKQNEMEQQIPIDIRLYYPILTANCERIDFGICLVGQTRQREFILRNGTRSTSAWSLRKGKD